MAKWRQTQCVIWGEQRLCRILSTYPAAGHSPEQNYIHNPASSASQKPDNKVCSLKPHRSFHQQNTQCRPRMLIQLLKIKQLQQKIQRNISQRKQYVNISLKKFYQIQHATDSQIHDMDHFCNSNHYLLWNQGKPIKFKKMKATTAFNFSEPHSESLLKLWSHHNIKIQAK